MRFSGLAALLAPIALFACNTGNTDVKPEPKVTPPAPAAAATEGSLRLGAPIENSAEKVSLADVAKNPNAFMGKKFATTGTVTAVCQSMGCWMEIKDDASAAHIKMAGHAFFVPKTASGKKARILATLEKNDKEDTCAEDEGEGEGKMAAAGGASPGAKKGCKAEAESQLGRPLAKLELVADGVELMN